MFIYKTFHACFHVCLTYYPCSLQFPTETCFFFFFFPTIRRAEAIWGLCYLLEGAKEDRFATNLMLAVVFQDAQDEDTCCLACSA